jgi:hypothetical protein
MEPFSLKIHLNEKLKIIGEFGLCSWYSWKTKPSMSKDLMKVIWKFFCT